MSTPRPAAEFLVRSSINLLPKNVRNRYRRELMAELHSLERSEQLHYAVGFASRTWALRMALSGGEPAMLGATVPKAPLHCRLHLWHHYRQLSTEDGGLYRSCVNCGRDDPGGFHDAARYVKSGSGGFLPG